MTTNTELIARLRSFEADHKPEGWPAIQMRDVSALLDAIEALEAGVERLKDEAHQDGLLRVRYGNELDNLRAQLAAAQGQVGEQRGYKDGAYLERNRLVALLSKVFPSGKKKTAIEGWSEDWHGCVYIELPTGQASWHYHDSQAWLFEHLPEYQGTWDGHTTEEKYERIQGYAAPIPQQVAEPSVPEGWKLVPIEPTEAMLEVGFFAENDVFDSAKTKRIHVWKDMLSAAPQPKEKQ